MREGDPATQQVFFQEGNPRICFTGLCGSLALARGVSWLLLYKPLAPFQGCKPGGDTVTQRRLPRGFPSAKARVPSGTCSKCTTQGLG